MSVAKVTVKDNICSQAFHLVGRFGSECSVSDANNEGDRTSNNYVLLASRTLMWSLKGLMRWPSSVGMSAVLIKLDLVPVQSKTEYRFKACRVSPKYASIL